MIVSMPMVMCVGMLVITMVVIVVMMIMIVVIVMMYVLGRAMVMVARLTGTMMVIAFVVVGMNVLSQFLRVHLSLTDQIPDADAANNRERCQDDAAQQYEQIELRRQDVEFHEQIDFPNQEADCREQSANENGADLIENEILVVMRMGMSHDCSPFMILN